MTGTTAADELIAEFDAERPSRRLSGRVAQIVTVIAFGLSLYVLYWTFWPGPVVPYRMLFLAIVLPLTFVCYKQGRRSTDRPGVADWVLAGLSFVACLYPLVVFDEFIRRAFEPTTLDVVAGAAIVLLVLEARSEEHTSELQSPCCISYAVS